MKKKPRIDRRALLREAIAIIAEEREMVFTSASIPSTGKVPDAGDRAELRKLDRWLRKAKAAVA